MESNATTARSVELHNDLTDEAGRYWRQSADQRWVKDMSHWRGLGRWEDDRAWNGIGARHLEYYRRLKLLSGREAPVCSMMEWGPGGGGTRTYRLPAKWPGSTGWIFPPPICRNAAGSFRRSTTTAFGRSRSMPTRQSSVWNRSTIRWISCFAPPCFSTSQARAMASG